MSIDFVAASNEYITVADANSLDLRSGFSITLWGDWDSAAGTVRLLSKANAYGMGYHDDGVAGKLLFTSYGVKDYVTASAYVTTGVHHCAIVFDSSNDVSFYWDGVFREKISHNVSCSASGDPLLIGLAGVGAQQFDGRLEDFRLFDTELTPNEIATSAAGYRGVRGGEVLWLSMNEARGAAGGWEGTSLANGTNLLPDLSLYSNDGDPVNTPTGRASKMPRYGVAV